MVAKFKKCNDCRYKDRKKDVFPCSDCDGSVPITCRDCRTHWFGECKKGIRPCKDFKWS